MVPILEKSFDAIDIDIGADQGEGQRDPSTRALLGSLLDRRSQLGAAPPS